MVKLSYGRISRLHAHLLTPPSKLDRRRTGRLGNRDKSLTGEGEKGVGVEPNQKPPQEKTSINPSILSAALQTAKDLYLSVNFLKSAIKFRLISLKNFVSNLRKTIVKKVSLLLRKEVIQRLIPSYCIFSEACNVPHCNMHLKIHLGILAGRFRRIFAS